MAKRLGKIYLVLIWYNDVIVTCHGIKIIKLWNTQKQPTEVFCKKR